jgi:hypothetical protein
MPVPFDIIVSAENRPYLAWQTRLFCHSALTRLNQAPIVVVHDTSGPLLLDFVSLQRIGCRVVRAPSFARTPHGTLYPARNAVGTLFVASTAGIVTKDHLLFCEPDLLFVEPPAFEGPLSTCFYKYVEYDSERIRVVLKAFGIDARVEELSTHSRMGVPYFMSMDVAERLARRWFEVLDTFHPVEWIDPMPAFGIAAMLEGIRPRTMRALTTNTDHARPLTVPIIHYCNGDAIWDKRRYMGHETPLTVPDAELPVGQPGTVLEEMMRQVREARRFYQRDGRRGVSGLVYSCLNKVAGFWASANRRQSADATPAAASSSPEAATQARKSIG